MKPWVDPHNATVMIGSDTGTAVFLIPSSNYWQFHVCGIKNCIFGVHLLKVYRFRIQRLRANSIKVYRFQ